MLKRRTTVNIWSMCTVNKLMKKRRVSCKLLNAYDIEGALSQYFLCKRICVSMLRRYHMPRIQVAATLPYLNKGIDWKPKSIATILPTDRSTLLQFANANVWKPNAIMGTEKCCAKEEIDGILRLCHGDSYFSQPDVRCRIRPIILPAQKKEMGSILVLIIAISFVKCHE